MTPAGAVRRARETADSMIAHQPATPMIVEVEVDTLAQLEEVLGAGPDLVLLDNMSPEWLSRAVALRHALAPGIELEASGGVTLASVAAIAASGVERISVGALTHSAPALDVGLDWR
jgi:nicotinate-nucleotide pyrophosphorylase (carboxylating)